MTPLRHALPLALAVAGCASNPAEEPSQGTISAPIVGGELDLTHTAVLDILVEGEQSCTGTLISPHVVLTAAHCVVEDVTDPTELVVFTGPDESNLAGGVLHQVVAAPLHPTYGTDPEDEDIGDMAVLVLAEPSTIVPMLYSKQPLTEDMIGDPVTVVGYGDTTIQYPTSGGGARRSLTLPLLDFDENWVMAGGGGKSQCYGDSGGPMLMELGGVERIIGVDSWSEADDCGGLEYNTRVDLLSAWIDEQVETYDPGFGDDGGGDDGGGGSTGVGAGAGAGIGGGAGVGEGDGDGGDDTGDSGGEDTDDDGDASGADASGGCQASAGPNGGSAAPSLLVALLLLVAGQRRASMANWFQSRA